MNLLSQCAGPYMGAPDDNDAPDLSLYEMDREEAFELIEWYAANGRPRAAWAEVRYEIQIHFEDRPCDGAHLANRGMPWDGWEKSLADWDDYREQQIKLRQAAHERWLAGLRKLLLLRRNIPKIAAEANRRRPQYERERLTRFNEVFHGEAA
jgi:hypothetical protein